MVTKQTTVYKTYMAFPTTFYTAELDGYSFYFLYNEVPN